MWWRLYKAKEELLRIFKHMNIFVVIEHMCDADLNIELVRRV